MKKYIMLFNVDEEAESDSNEYSDIIKFIGEENSIFVNYQLYHSGDNNPKKYEGRSLWVTQEYYVLS